MSGEPDNTLADQKRVLRAEMREVRKNLTDRPERSAVIWQRVQSRPDVTAAQNVMAFASIASEPDTAAFLAWCGAHGKHTAVPEDDVDPQWPDVVIVPGLAFTADGQRCGQGGGWYDRFLPQVRDDCATIGVCFAPQLVVSVPTEDHDVVLDAIVTDERSTRRDASGCG